MEVFRLFLPRRGAKAKDDRLFLEALHYFAVHNITWRALPERFGPITGSTVSDHQSERSDAGVPFWGEVIGFGS